MHFSAKTFHRTSANFNFIHDKRQNVCFVLNQISVDSWKIIKILFRCKNSDKSDKRFPVFVIVVCVIHCNQMNVCIATFLFIVHLIVDKKRQRAHEQAHLYRLSVLHTVLRTLRSLMEFWRKFSEGLCKFTNALQDIVHYIKDVPTQ
jgi:hypothetical protein